MRLDPVENESVILNWPLGASIAVIMRIHTVFEALNYFVAYHIRVKTVADALKTVSGAFVCIHLFVS